MCSFGVLGCCGFRIGSLRETCDAGLVDTLGRDVDCWTGLGSGLGGEIGSGASWGSGFNALATGVGLVGVGSRTGLGGGVGCWTGLGSGLIGDGSRTGLGSGSTAGGVGSRTGLGGGVGCWTDLGSGLPVDGVGSGTDLGSGSTGGGVSSRTGSTGGGVGSRMGDGSRAGAGFGVETRSCAGVGGLGSSSSLKNDVLYFPNSSMNWNDIDYTVCFITLYPPIPIRHTFWRSGDSYSYTILLKASCTGFHKKNENKKHQHSLSSKYT